MLNLIDLVRPYTKASEQRLTAFEDALKTLEIEKIPGDVVECGVWRGGHIILARILTPDRVCWLYDTFAGMPPAGPEDKHRSGRRAVNMTGKSAVPLMDVIADFKTMGVYDETKLRFVPGMVEDTLDKTKPQQIAMLRLDTDWYASTKKSLQVLWPLVVDGGFLLVDDYGHWMGARQAVCEYFGPKVKDLKEIDYTAVILRKRKVQP